MPRPARRRQTELASSQPITNFIHLSKTQASFYNDTKKTIATTGPGSRKRKASTVIDGDHSALARRNTSFSPSGDEEDELPTPSKRLCLRTEPKPDDAARVKSLRLITKGKQTAKPSLARSETAHKPSESTILAKSRRQDKKIQTKLDIGAKKLAAAAAATSKLANPSNDLPAHLADLMRLHKAFLETMVLQFAHAGRNTPVDFRTIAPHVSRNWGKRQVTVEDIRRCIAVQSCSHKGRVSPFIVSDYGRGKVCVEVNPDCGDSSVIDEKRLCAEFEENLRELGAQRDADRMADVEVLPLEGLTLADLPQANITNMDFGMRVDLRLARGQRALAELKNDMAAKETEKETAAAAAHKNPVLNPDGSKMSVLDRLRMKEQAKANAPLPLSGPELQRRAALNRVADVAATVSMLSLSNPLSLPRQAFTMTAITDKLKDSLRVPMSREEATGCIRVIANEVAPEWLRIVSIGGRENVVVQRHSQPVDRVIHERVQKLLA